MDILRVRVEVVCLGLQICICLRDGTLLRKLKNTVYRRRILIYPDHGECDFVHRSFVYMSHSHGVSPTHCVSRLVGTSPASGCLLSISSSLGRASLASSRTPASLLAGSVLNADGAVSPTVPDAKVVGPGASYAGLKDPPPVYHCRAPEIEDGLISSSWAFSRVESQAFE